MTSPKTDHLPYVYGGMIWDGVTEYLDERPPGMGSVWLLRMYGDGTRRFSEFVGSGQSNGVICARRQRRDGSKSVSLSSSTERL